MKTDANLFQTIANGIDKFGEDLITSTQLIKGRLVEYMRDGKRYQEYLTEENEPRTVLMTQSPITYEQAEIIREQWRDKHSGIANAQPQPQPLKEVRDGQDIMEAEHINQLVRAVKALQNEYPARVLEKCKHCGQYGAIQHPCRHCGAPIDPQTH